MPKLIDLFNERQDDLYSNARYPHKEEKDTQPYRYTTLDKAEPMNPFTEDQSNPLSISARRDFNRMFQFSKSAKGLIFLGKQTFLQTGNTFAQTRLYNPLNVQLHSVPFVHAPRHVDVKQTIQSLFGGTSDPERYAKLQNETSDAAKVRGISRAEGKAGILKIDDATPTVSTRGFFDNIFGSLINTANNFASGFSAQFTNPTGDRPDINFYDRMVGVNRNLRNHYWFDKDSYRYMDNYVPLIKGDKFPSGTFPRKLSLKFRYQDDSVDPVRNSGAVRPMQNIVDYGTILPFARENEKYVEEVRKYKNITESGGPVEGKFKARLWRSRYVKDRTQLTPDVYRNKIINKDRNDKDTIDVLFVISGREQTEGHVRFTALIQDINETVTPTYNESKYIGRYETFYTYDKVIRDLSFSLTLHAFSKKELGHIHRKMNWLTSLTYPEKTGNYLTPTIVKLTIGNVYLDQPVLLQSLTHTIDNDTSWDIDEKHPMTIQSDIQMRLLDKEHYVPGNQTKIYGYDSFGIVYEDLANLSTEESEQINQSIREDGLRAQEQLARLRG